MDTSWQHILRQVHRQDKLRVCNFFAGHLNHVRVLGGGFGKLKHCVQIVVVPRVKGGGGLED